MSDNSRIEWTDATWNPIVGCSIVSPGCTNCYAMKMAGRLEKINRTGGSGTNYVNHYDGTTERVNGNTVWTGKLARAPQKTLLAPLGRKAPTKYFVNSMGDLFHEDCPDDWIDQVFAVMALCPQHTFQVLTKRAERMRNYLTKSITPNMIGECAREIQADVPLRLAPWPLPNVWLGVSCERQKEADKRIPLLLQTRAAVRFISAEPLLGPIDLMSLKYDDGERIVSATTGDRGWRDGDCWEAEGTGPILDWVIVGGESGRSARPMSIQWARELRDQCAASGVAFFFKQWGEWAPAGLHQSGAPGRFAFGDYEHDRSAMIQCDGYPRQFTKYGARSTVQHLGKKAAGRLLDGREHNDMPGCI